VVVRPLGPEPSIGPFLGTPYTVSHREVATTPHPSQYSTNQQSGGFASN